MTKRSFAATYFTTALSIIDTNNGNQPLHFVLRQYFANHKKHGSRDRKAIAQLCYTYHRIGIAFSKETPATQLQIALFLCNDHANEWANVLPELWIQAWSEQLEERILFIQSQFPNFKISQVLPLSEQLSNGLDASVYAKSLLVQPNVFIRIRPKQAEKVLQQLKEAAIFYEIIHNDCIAVPPSTKLDAVLVLNKQVVVQDISSQKVRNVLLPVVAAFADKKIHIWDCCAASGGKSILAVDLFKQVSLTVSDIRPAILHNLKERFKAANITQYQSFIADLSIPNFSLPKPQQFDLIICDAPCSGSGTWARTPEQMQGFDMQQLQSFSQLQQRIVQNIIAYIKKNGYLLYITCSVYAAENEAIVSFIIEKSSFTLVKQALITGYELKGDTMFAALFVHAA